MVQQDATADARMRLTLHVPEDADVYLVGQKMTMTGETRTFESPELQSGQSYVYPIRIEVVRNGETIAVEHQQVVRAGDNLELEFVEQSNEIALANR